MAQSPSWDSYALTPNKPNAINRFTTMHMKKVILK